MPLSEDEAAYVPLDEAGNVLNAEGGILYTRKGSALFDQDGKLNEENLTLDEEDGLCRWELTGEFGEVRTRFCDTVRNCHSALLFVCRAVARSVDAWRRCRQRSAELALSLLAVVQGSALGRAGVPSSALSACKARRCHRDTRFAVHRSFTLALFARNASASTVKYSAIHAYLSEPFARSVFFIIIIIRFLCIQPSLSAQKRGFKMQYVDPSDYAVNDEDENIYLDGQTEESLGHVDNLMVGAICGGYTDDDYAVKYQMDASEALFKWVDLARIYEEVRFFP